MRGAMQNIQYQHGRERDQKWCARLPLHELTFSLHLKMTAVFHFPRRDLTGMAVMALMNARINRRWETRQRRRWMCLKGSILGSYEVSEKPGFHFWNSSVCMRKTSGVLSRPTCIFVCLIHKSFGHGPQQISQIGHGQSEALRLSVWAYVCSSSASFSIPQLWSQWMWRMKVKRHPLVQVGKNKACISFCVSRSWLIVKLE